MRVQYITDSSVVSGSLTTITTYLWPGFLGEFEHETQAFRAWSLDGPTTWTLRPDILAPPLRCLGQCDSRGVRRFEEGREYWVQDRVTRILEEVTG